MHEMGHWMAHGKERGMAQWMGQREPVMAHGTELMLGCSMATKSALEKALEKVIFVLSEPTEQPEIILLESTTDSILVVFLLNSSPKETKKVKMVN